jgi:ketosteroid isomerase-like protein
VGEHKELLQDRYQRFVSGDVQGATQEWDENFTWDGAGEGLPGSGEHQGADALKVLQEAVGQWDKFELSPDEYIEDGDTVVVLAHQVVAKGGQEKQLPVVHIWRFDGDRPVRLQILTDTDAVAKLLGRR